MDVGIQSTFVDAVAKLSRSDQRRAWDTVREFQLNSHSPGLHVEPIRQAVDPKMFSARVSQTHRAILVKSENDDAALFVWVDQHDKAYQWARNKRFEPDLSVGAIRMWSVVDAGVTAGDVSSSSATPTATPGASSVWHLFDQYTDEQLLALHVPEGALPRVRMVENSDELDALDSEFSPDVMLALQALSTGDPYDEVNETLQAIWAEDVDLDNDSHLEQGGEVHPGQSAFAAAMRGRGSSSSIVVLNSDVDLQNILDQPLERWRTFLHPSQKDLVERNYRGPVRVLGGAGTGKTVVAMHRARRLAREVLTGNERLLFTTFSVNLAAGIRQTMSSFCSAEEMAKIDVLSIDRLAKKVLDLTNQRVRLVYDERELREVWLSALQLCGEPIDRLDFIREEYARVIQQNGVTTWEEYRDVGRTGRSVRLSRSERSTAWQVVETYRQLMRDKQAVDGIDLFVWARLAVENTPGLLAYRCAVVDEAQDLHPEAYRFLRAVIPVASNDLFIVGDAHQRIYDRSVVLGRCGINIRGQRSKRLYVNYRTTDQIRRAAMHVLTGLSFDDLDGSIDSGKDISLLSGQVPAQKTFSGLAEEQHAVVEDIRRLVEQGIELREIAILARTRAIAEGYMQALMADGISATFIHRNQPNTDDGVRCATMHGSKGLEFRVVFLVSVNDDLFPPMHMDTDQMSPEQRSDVERAERSLLYVAGTRAREQLYVYSSDTPSRFWRSN